MKHLKSEGSKIVIYESVLKEETFFNSNVIKDLKPSKVMSNVIVSICLSGHLKEVSEEVYTLDLYQTN